MQNQEPLKLNKEIKLKDLQKKIVPQKGGGGARHASKKAPLFIGGGVAHGPKGELAYKTRKLNKSEKKQSIASLISEKVKNKTKGLVVLNKIDSHKSVVKGIYCVSAKTGEGIEDLTNAIVEAVKDSFDTDLVSERVYRNLSGVVALIKNSGIGSDYYEQTSQNLRDSLILLEEINGTFSNEDVLDQIFNKFCIGK